MPSRLSSHDQDVSAILVDPSLFTGPYDAGLSGGLRAAGVVNSWAVRPLRQSQRPDLPEDATRPIFYRHVDDLSWLKGGARKIAKSLAHLVGWWRLFGLIKREQATVLHLQWAVIPAIDALCMKLAKRRCVLVVTVHDATPFNGEKISLVQNMAFDRPAQVADRVIVHTRSAMETLVKRGIAREKIRVVPHGPMTLRVDPAEVPPPPHRDPRATFVLFGQIKPYKGLDILIEALALLAPSTRSRLRVIVAGAPMMDMLPIETRIAELELADIVELRLGRLSEPQMAALFAEADTFVFPYRQIDASGVYYLVRSLGKWIIASKVGVFDEDFVPDQDGEQVPPGDAEALAAAILRAVDRPAPSREGGYGASWETIGAATRAIYLEATSERAT